MISLDQWRAAIGRFALRRVRSLMQPAGIPSSTGASLAVLCVLFLLLVIAGDVESNPGPINNAVSILDFQNSVE